MFSYDKSFEPISDEYQIWEFINAKKDVPVYLS